MQMASHSQVGSPVTPALAGTPKDAALHLLCLAAEANHHPQSLPRQHHHHPHPHYPIYLSPPPPPPPSLSPSLPPHSHFLYHPLHYTTTTSHSLPHHPIIHPLPYHQQLPSPTPQPQTPQQRLPYTPLIPSTSPVLSVPLPVTSPTLSPIQSHPPIHKVKGPWRPEEDAILTQLVSKLGPRRWTGIASHIPGRTGKQARERWLNQLSPHLAKRPWTPEEDRIVMDAHARLGNRWSEIAKLLNGRTDNATKNRFNTTIRRQISELSTHAREGLTAGVKKGDAAASSIVTSASKSTTLPTSPNTSDEENEHKVGVKRKREATSRVVIEPLAQRPKTVTASS